MENYVTKLEPCTVIIQRRNILSSVFRAVQRTDFDFHRPLTVTFSGEDATDEGGPTREFFRLKFLLQLYLLKASYHFSVCLLCKTSAKHVGKNHFLAIAAITLITYSHKIIIRILDICVK